MLNPKLSCQKASSLLTQAGLVDDTTRPRFLPWSSDTGLSNNGASLLGGSRNASRVSNISLVEAFLLGSPEMRRPDHVRLQLIRTFYRSDA